MMRFLARTGLRARMLALLTVAVLLTTVLAALLFAGIDRRPPGPSGPPSTSGPRDMTGEMDSRRPPPMNEHGERRDDRPPPPANVPITRLLWVALIGLTAILPLGWLLASSWTGWLARLTESTRQFGTARTSNPLPVNGPTELRDAAQAFNEMHERVGRQLHDRTQMVGAIAHDLRTPLTRLAFRLEELDEPLRSRVENDMREINMLISAAMEFIRDQSLQRSHERLDMRLLVESVADDLIDMGHDVQVEPGSPITLTGDPLALKRVIGNLLDNALKYGHSARVRLAASDGQCVLQIDDSGPGIPEALLTRVFEPFFRVEASRSRETGGMGLGLAAVRAIVVEHGGNVWLANRKDGGLRVTVQLPLGNAGRSDA
ncbi:ATP-binding protein [Diaphorobacter caeni]|uniref:ATP-binding protein n=1 Tax=Diaphorobacter caeni TaxID=2784387 RepID=UPI00188ECD24|nr:ATP-binding protein [Diaphorobacter caeni]MBF5003149.1 HAMP domain-containing protein [Diaphorobacter caeni]